MSERTNWTWNAWQWKLIVRTAVDEKKFRADKSTRRLADIHSKLLRAAAVTASYAKKKPGTIF